MDKRFFAWNAGMGLLAAGAAIGFKNCPVEKIRIGCSAIFFLAIVAIVANPFSPFPTEAMEKIRQKLS